MRKNEKSGFPLDKDWIATSFMMPAHPEQNGYTEHDLKWLYFSSADVKYTNTSLGGNLAINNPPQYTIFADPPTGLLVGKLDPTSESIGMGHGMGRYYSEAIDDNQQRVTMRFGRPQYKGLITFFTGFYNGKMSLLGNQGRLDLNLFYFAGKIVGCVVALPLLPLILAGKAMKMVLGRPSTKYYWLKPTMVLYWNRCNLICNAIAANMGLVPDGGPHLDSAGNDITNEVYGGEYPLLDTDSSEAYKSYMYNQVKRYMPDLFQEHGGIDIYRVVNKLPRMQDKIHEDMLDRINRGKSTADLMLDLAGYLTHGLFTVHKHLYDGTGIYEALDCYHRSMVGGTKIQVAGEEVDVTDKSPVLDRLNQAGDAITTMTKNKVLNQGTSGDLASGAAGSLDQAAQSSNSGSQPTTPTSTTDSTTRSMDRSVDDDVAEIVKHGTGGGSYPVWMNNNAPTTSTPSNTGTTSSSSGGYTLQGGSLGITGSIPKIQDKVDHNATSTSKDVTNSASTDSTDTSGGDGAAQGQPATDNEITNALGTVSAKEEYDLNKEVAKQDSKLRSIVEYDPTTDALKRTVGGLLKGLTSGDAYQYFTSGPGRGQDWISYHVSSSNTVSESFSNMVERSEIEGAINGASSQTRSLSFNFSNFQTGFAAIDGVAKMLQSTVVGIMDGFQISGLLALAGSGCVDIPKRWTDSSANLTTETYTMELRVASGDPLSQFLYLYVPFLTLLAATLPISHGNASYGEPFLCELYHKGRNTIRLGMITSLEVTRGTGTVGWSELGMPLGLDISFTVTNMDSIMHMPIESGLQSIFPFKGIFADDMAYQDYIATLSAQSVYEMTNTLKKMDMRFKEWTMNMDLSLGSRFGLWISDRPIIRSITALVGNGLNPKLR